MIRRDKETGKIYNKKTRFSGVPYPYIVVSDKSDLETGYDLYRSIAMNKQGYWLDFAQYHVFRNELLKDKSITEQLQLYLIDTAESTKNQIIQELSNLGYNPFIDNIPFESMSENIKKYLYKKREIIEQTYNLLIKNIIIEKNVLILPLITNINECEREILFKLGINVIILYQDKKCEICFNETKKHFYEIKGKTIKIKNIHSILKEFNTNWSYNEEKKVLECLKNTDALEDIILTIKQNIF